jgi:hypothetical protein
MRYWFDTEFIEDGKTIDLISIGIVAEDGRELYAESREADLKRADQWVKDNVVVHLVHHGHGEHVSADDFPSCPLRYRKTIAAMMIDFCDPEKYGKPEFWAYYADYDWVALCRLFGRMIDLPKGWPMYCRDIKQEADRMEEWIRVEDSRPSYKLRLPEQGKGEHHALADARWNREAWEYLRDLDR